MTWIGHICEEFGLKLISAEILVDQFQANMLVLVYQLEHRDTRNGMIFKFLVNNNFGSLTSFNTIRAYLQRPPAFISSSTNGEHNSFYILVFLLDKLIL